MRRGREKGSAVVYILMAIALLGILIASLMRGPEKNISTEVLDQTVIKLQGDIGAIHAAISECVLTYSKPAAAANPNVPFPLYGDLSSGGDGAPLAEIKCPGAPASQQVIFGDMGVGKLTLLSNTALYAVTYVSDDTEGVYLRVTRAEPSPLWSEAISRTEGKYSACAAAAVTAAGDCANGCFYYWILRRPTSTLGGEAGCP